jgi:hypothetical protein
VDLEARHAAIISEAQRRADNRGTAFRVYKAFGCYSVNLAADPLPAGAEIAILQPGAAPRVNPFAD